MGDFLGRRKASRARARNAMLAADPVRPTAILAAALALSPPAARATEVACWFEAGVLVVPAEVAGIAGDYVLDTGAPRTLLHATQAQGAGYAEPEIAASIRLAGLDLPARSVSVVKLDARFWRLPTPVAGVIGADVLRGLMLDVRFAPCRIWLWRRAEAPRFAADAVLPIAWADGRPTVLARVTDGRRVLGGAFVPATGADTAVRLRDDRADVPGAVKRADLYPYGALRPKLRALSLGGELFEEPLSGLIERAQIQADGEIGAPALARWRLRFDLVGDRLALAKEKGPPDRSGGP
jgi:hypothetical protein